MNLSGFKKTAEDKKTVTMTHANGHMIKLAKSALSHIQRKQIEKIPLHLAQGSEFGPVTADDSGQDQAAPTPQREPASIGAPGLVSFDKTPEQVDAEELRSDAKKSIAPEEASTDLPGAGTPVSAANPQQKAAVDSKPADNSLSLTGGGSNPDVPRLYHNAQKAIDSDANLAGQLAQRKAEIEEQRIIGEQQFQASNAKNLADFTQHAKDFQDYIANNPIDPKHYQENMSATQKVTTAIGLLLGGFTGGFNKTGVNPAMEFLNKQIERDIEAQKSRMDGQKTILGANQDLYKDEVLANNAARINMNQIYDHKIQQAADQLGTDAAKNIAAQEHLKLAATNNELLQQSSLRASVGQQLKAGGTGISPLALGNAGYIPKAEALKEQESIDAQNGAIKNIHDLYAQAKQEINPKELLNPASATRLATFNAGLADQVLRTDKVNRFNPQTAKIFVAPYTLSTRDFIQGTADAKEIAFLQKLQALHSGDTPYTAKIAPGALPQYPTVGGSSAPKYKVGDIVYKNGVKAQVLPGGQLKAVK